MSDMPAVWECQRSVDADVPVSFAWSYMTNVSNWSDPPAEFSLDGPFAAGSRGTTRMPGQPARGWVIRDVVPGRAYTIESALPEEVLLLFHWRFEELSDRRTRMTQRIELYGENAAAYVDQIRAGFEPNLEPGLRRIAERMADA
jgi:Polyketide cyclase / dehydrase and lipid transport